MNEETYGTPEMLRAVGLNRNNFQSMMGAKLITSSVPRDEKKQGAAYRWTRDDVYRIAVFRDLQDFGMSRGRARDVAAEMAKLTFKNVGEGRGQFRYLVMGFTERDGREEVTEQLLVDGHPARLDGQRGIFIDVARIKADVDSRL